MKTIKNILYVGLNDKRTKQQEIDTLSAFKIATNIFIELTGGATITEATGIYTHEDGTIITEKTLRCEIFNAEKQAIKKAIDNLKIALNQESIAVETVETESEFI